MDANRSRILVTGRTLSERSDTGTFCTSFRLMAHDQSSHAGYYSPLNELAANKTVRLIWVPGHSGIPGNERADELARQASSQSLVGPEPALPISHTVIKQLSGTGHTNRMKNAGGV